MLRSQHIVSVAISICCMRSWKHGYLIFCYGTLQSIPATPASLKRFSVLQISLKIVRQPMIINLYSRFLYILLRHVQEIPKPFVLLKMSLEKDLVYV